MAEHYSLLGPANESRVLHQDHVSQMREYYRRTAGKYNSWHFNLDDDYAHNCAVRQVIGLLAQQRDSTLLDVACGTGRGIKAALDAGFEAQGIDLCPDLLEIAKRDLKIPHEKLHCGDATQLPFPDNSFDVVCIFSALHHSAMPHTIVSELIRVARRAVVISDEANHLHGGVRQLLIKLGLFRPVYRLLFRREPKIVRRGATSEGDGPTFDFSLEEIIPMVKRRFGRVRCISFYKIGKLHLHGFRLPRLFARQGILVAEKKTRADDKLGSQT